jgi:hypothetical protein
MEIHWIWYLRLKKQWKFIRDFLSEIWMEILGLSGLETRLGMSRLKPCYNHHVCPENWPDCKNWEHIVCKSVWFW